MKKRKKRVTKEQKIKMRKAVAKKKYNDHGGIFQEHRFCLAYLKIIDDPKGNLFQKCTYLYKPKEGCDMCFCNRKKQRWDYI